MEKDLILKEEFNLAFDWYKMIKISIIKDGANIGYIGTYLMNKQDIEENMSWDDEEELIDYIEDDLRLYRKTCRFIYENLSENKDCLFIDEIFINEDKRNKKYGSISLNKLINNFNGRILLQASPLLSLINFDDYLNGRNEEIKKWTNKLVKFYEKLGFKIKEYPYMIRN